MKIGLFDSGLGGLVILSAVTHELPQYDYEYYGDTANVPYGDKTEAEIYELVKAGVGELFTRDCKLVILACNTASAETLRRLQDEWLPQTYPGRRILGVIIPVVEEVVASTCKRVLLLATKRTISSGKYHFELGKLDTQHVKIEGEATSELVPLIEAGDVDAAFVVVKRELDQRAGDIDGVILGCTHYTLLKDRIRAKYGESLTVFSQDEIIPKKLVLYLLNHPEIESILTKTAKRNIYLTEHRKDYDELAAQFLDGQFVNN